MTFAAALRRISGLAQDGVLGPDGGWLAAAIENHLAGAMPLDQALTRAFGNACRSRRDQMLREYARSFLPGNSAWAAAQIVATQVRRYETTSWIRDRNSAEMPPAYRETPREWLFNACQANADAGERGMPISPRQIMRILNGMSRHENLRHDPHLPMSKPATAECPKQEIERHEGESDPAFAQRQRRSRRA